jgi:Trk K+ transport system NAD-binding subunit
MKKLSNNKKKMKNNSDRNNAIQPSFTEKLYYQLDCYLSASPSHRFTLLFGLSFTTVCICAFLSKLAFQTLNTEFAFAEAMWWSLTRVMDTGKFGDDEGFYVRAVSVFTSLCGLMVVASLIGLVNNFLDERIDNLRQGKSIVIDSNHTLILGFENEKVLAILHELIEWNKDALMRGEQFKDQAATVVILSKEDKIQVENYIREHILDMANTRVIVRQGSPFSPFDLKKVGAGRARSIIILADKSERPLIKNREDITDMAAIKTLLALHRVEGTLFNNHVVVELYDASRRAVVERIGRGSVEVVNMQETLSRILVQTSRQRGLAEVYAALLTFEGSEFHFKYYPEIVGKKFGDLQWKMKDAIVLGIERTILDPTTNENNLQTILNPPDDFIIEKNDELLVLAEESAPFGFTANHKPVEPKRLKTKKISEVKPEHYLICSYSRKLPHILKEFDAYAIDGSSIYLFPGVSEQEFNDVIEKDKLNLKHINLIYVEGDPTSAADLNKVLDFISKITCTIVISLDLASEQEADAHTIITVLQLSELFDKHLGENKPRIISEILDARSQELLEQDIGAEYVLSTLITSRLIAQVSEQRGLNRIFGELFSEIGNEVYLKHAEGYCIIGEPITWISLQKVARTHSEIAIGYLKKNSRTPIIDPPQTKEYIFEKDDRIIVIAETDCEYVYENSKEPQ